MRPVFCTSLALMSAAAMALWHQSQACPEGRGGSPLKRQPGWHSLLLPPAEKTKKLPRDWKVVTEPKDRVEPRGGGAMGGFWPRPETVDELVRESVIVVVGLCAGHGPSFHAEPWSGNLAELQYTTHYLRVEGYLKDTTGRRAAFLKVIGPGGFLHGGQTGGEGVPFPYLRTGHRYLLYLTPNYGYWFGGKNVRASQLIGRGDEYWTTGWRNGLWWVQDGKLTGYAGEKEDWADLGAGRPLVEAIQSMSRAVERERLGVPLPPRPRPQLPGDQ